MMIVIAGLAAVAAPQEARGPLLIDRDRIDRPRVPAAPPPRRDPAPSARIASQGSAEPIAGVRFRGAEAPAPVAAAARRFLGRPATRDTLAELAAALSDAYSDSNVALYTVAIPEQDFAGGVVDVLLTEGSIAKAAVKTDRPGAHPRLRERMAPLVGQKPLTRATFERQFTLMRAIPGLAIEPDLSDPAGTGELELVVTPKQRRTKFSLGYSNRGIDLLGDGQFDARAELYGALRDGDQLTVTGSAARDFRQYRYASAAYAVPVAPNGLTLGASVGYLDTRPRGLPVRGTAKLAGVTLNWPVLRSFKRSADIGLGVDGIDSDNAVFGNVVALERTRAVRLAGSYAAAGKRGSVAVSGSLSKGIDALGARVTAPLAEPGFAKATVAASAARGFGKRVTVRASAQAQYSRDALPAAERFAIGGEAIGRAFDTGFLTGDRGVGALAELAVRPIGGGRLAASEIYGFADAGMVSIVARGAAPGGDFGVASAGVGGRVKWRDKAELGLEAARVIDDPYPNYPDDWRVSVSWRLSL